MALVNFKKGLLASLPSTYAEGTFYVTTDERAIYLDVAADKRIRLGDFQEFANLAALEANANPSTSALYYITEGNILAKWDGEKYVQINVQKTLEELGGVSKTEFDGVIYDQGEGEAKVKGLISKVADLESTVDGIVSVGGEANVIETVKVNGTALTVTDRAVDVIVPTGALASKDSVAKTDLTSELSAEIDNKVVKEDGKSLVLDTEITKLAGVSTGANKVEASSNGSIKIDGVDTVVYTHPDKHAIDDVTGLQAALDAKVNAADYTADKATFALKSEVESAIGSVHTHDNKDELDKINAGDVAKWNAEIGTKAIVDANKATWDLAATALQSHQDISHLATEADLTLAENRIADAEADIVELKKIQVTETSVTDGTNTFTKYDDTALVGRVATIEGDYLKTADIADFETKENVKKVSDDLADYKTANDVALAGVKATADAAAVKTEVETALAGKVDKVEGKSLISDSEITRLASVTNYDDTALTSRVEAIENDYLKAADKNGLQEQITANASAISLLTNGVSADEVDGVNDLIQYVKDHGAEVTGIKADIAANTKAVADEKTRAEGIEAGLAGRIATIEGDYLKSADKTELEGKINAINDHSHTFVESELNEIKAGDVAKWNTAVSDLATHTAIDHDFASYVDRRIVRVTSEEEIDALLQPEYLGTIVLYASGVNPAARFTVIGRYEDNSAYIITTVSDTSTIIAERLVDTADIDNITLSITNMSNTINTLAPRTEVAKKADKETTYTKDEVNAAIAAAVETAHTWGTF